MLLQLYSLLIALQPTLNSAAAVKKWMPSIKDEIEYYLQVKGLRAVFAHDKRPRVPSNGEMFEKETSTLPQLYLATIGL